MTTEFPPPDARLAGKVKVVQLSAQREVLRVASSDDHRNKSSFNPTLAAKSANSPISTSSNMSSSARALPSASMFGRRRWIAWSQLNATNSMTGASKVEP